MHNDLAWAVLGVDPATGKLVEDAAKRRGASVGRWLELTLAELRAVAAERASIELASRKREQHLRDLMADMAESLMTAAELLRKDKPSTEEMSAQQAEVADPLHRAATEMDASAPNVENIQAWMRRLEDNAPQTSARPARRGFLRRSA
jgi:methyl-accepting chemotaxis protein